MIDTRLLDECHRLALEVAPELQQHPLYVCDSTIFDGLPFRRHFTVGWALPGSQYTDFNIRAAIGDSWAGPGNVVAICESEIREAIQSEACFRGAVLNVTVHEAAHLVPQGYIPTDDLAEIFDCPAVRELQLTRRAEANAEANAQPEPPPDADACVHGRDFVRRVVHLWARATLAGWTVPYGSLFGADLYFIPQMPHFLATLLPELFRLQTASFEEIERTDPPSEFCELWRGCLEKYAFYNRPRNPKNDNND